MNRYYKIMDYSKDGPKTLFHANSGSRILPIRTWIKASKHKLVSDGSSSTQYMSGFHMFQTYDEAKQYLFKFFKNKCNKIIVRCWAMGDIRRKEHSRGNVFLAQNIYIEDIIFHQLEGY